MCGFEQQSLNESPSEKEGKFVDVSNMGPDITIASMKVPPKRKGNLDSSPLNTNEFERLNESPSEKEGKYL